MKKDDVIKELQAIPGNPEVCVFDWRKSIGEADADPTSIGIYPDLEIDIVGKDEIPKGSEPWIGIGFENTDYDEDGRYIPLLEDDFEVSAK